MAKAAAKKASTKKDLDQSATDLPVVHSEEPVELTEFWVGTLSTSPNQNLTLGGVSFPAFTERVHHPEGAFKTERQKYMGALVTLDRDQVKDVKEAAMTEIVRTEGQIRKLISGKTNYRPQRGDEPIAKHIYMISTEDAVQELGPRWREQEPPALMS
jgi:hypothetical protein